MDLKLRTWDVQDKAGSERVRIMLPATAFKSINKLERYTIAFIGGFATLCLTCLGSVLISRYANPLAVPAYMSNPIPSDSSTDAPPIGRQFSLRSLLLLPVPVALFSLTIWRLLAVLSEIHLGQRDVALSIGIGAVVGTLVGSGFWLAGHRLLGISLGIIAWSISIMTYVVLGLGIPVEFIIK